jgi:Zn-dependent M28 family amino/carboxypeptidase
VRWLALALTGLTISTLAAQAPPAVDRAELLRDLRVLSADDMAGREIGTPGGVRARAFIVERFQAVGLEPVDGVFVHPFTTPARGRAGPRSGANVLARITGTRAPDRVLVISAHYDHVGIRAGEIFNGADDNASGTAALFAVATYFNTRRPQNSLIFAALDAEETGLRGARALVATPPVEVASLAINQNMDMIGRDPDNLLYVAGTTAQPFLKPMIERVAASAPVRLVMGHDDPTKKDVENWTNSSDHRAFCEAKIPCLYFGVEDFANHHKASDDYETMTHAFYVRAVETMIRAVEEFDARLDDVLKARGPREPRLP